MNAPEIAALPILADVAAIFPSPTNPRRRFPQDKHEEMVESIREHDVLQPVLLRPWPKDGRLPRGKSVQDVLDAIDTFGGAYELVAGERRWRGAVDAPKAKILAIVRDLTDIQVMEMQIIENLQREDVHPLEEAEGYERLMKQGGYNADQLAAKVKKSRAYIYAKLKLLALAPKVRDLFFEGKLNASTALLVARIPGESLQAKAAAAITKPDWKGDIPSFRAAAEIIQNEFTLSLKKAAFKLDDAKLIADAGSCTKCPKRSGNDAILFADIKDPYVCTDPKCYNEKREINYLRLRELAEKAGQEIISGKEAQKMLASGTYSLRQHNLESLDATCYDDAQQRTFRQILGKNLPAITLVEDTRQKELIETVDQKLLAAALEKVGFSRKTEKPNAQSPEEKKKAAEREEKIRQFEIEVEWRGKLFQAIREKFGARFAESKLLATEELTLLAVNLFRHSAPRDDHIDDLMKMWGHQQNEEAAEEAEWDRFATHLSTLDAPALCLFLTDLSLIDETEVYQYQWAPGETPKRLMDEAKRQGIDALAMRKTIEDGRCEKKKAPAPAKKSVKTPATPKPAAQAPVKAATAPPVKPAKPAAPAKAEDSKKSTPKTATAKTKSTSASASPPNEPAAPVKTALNPQAAWPFPGVRK